MKDNEEKSGSIFLKGSSGVGILLLHGWTCFTGELLPLAQYLNRRGYTVSVPLLRGHGTRPEDLSGVKWQDWLEDAKKYLNDLKRQSKKVFVGGISMGGNISLFLSEDEAVAGVIPMGAATKYKFHVLAKIAVFFMGLWKTYRWKYYPWWVRDIAERREVYQYYPVESAKEVISLADATRMILPEITKPILIMQSTTDHMVSKNSPQTIFDGVKSKAKEIFWIKDAYHVFAGERKVWEKVGEFIEKNK